MTMNYPQDGRPVAKNGHEQGVARPGSICTRRLPRTPRLETVVRMDYNLPDEQVFLRKFGAVEIRLRTLDAAGYARLMGLGPYYPWSGINIHTSIPGKNGQLDTMVDVQRDWFACALAGKRDRTRPTIAVGRDVWAKGDHAARIPVATEEHPGCRVGQ